MRVRLDGLIAVCEPVGNAMEPLDLTAALDRARKEHLATEREQERERRATQRSVRDVMGSLRVELVRRGVAPEMKTFGAGLAAGDDLGPEMRVIPGNRDQSARVVEDVYGWDIPVGVVLAAINPSFEGTVAAPQHARYSGLTLWLPKLSDRFNANDSYSMYWQWSECGGGWSAEIPTWDVIPHLTLAAGVGGDLRFAVVVDGRYHLGPAFEEVLVAAVARIIT